MSIIRSYQANSNNKVINISYDYGHKNSNKQIRITNNVSEINILKNLSEQYGKNLTSIQSSATIYRIGPNCCKNAINLESFTGNVNLNEIMNDAFLGCSKLQSIIACRNVKRIGNNAFKDCSSLNNVEIGWNEIYSIGDNAFYNTAIKEADISLNDKSTNGSSIFQNCTQLQTINVGKNFIIKSNTFSGCSNLTKLSIESNYGGLEGDQCLGNIPQIQQIVIPSSTIGFPDRCFINDEKLNNISFTDYKDSKFKHIGNSAFSGCKLLTDIEIPASFNTVDCFGSNCFSGSNIITVTLHGFTDGYILNNKTSITNFGAGHEIIYVSSSGKKYKADSSGVKSVISRAIVCVNSIKMDLTDEDFGGYFTNTYYDGNILCDLLIKNNIVEEDNIRLLINAGNDGRGIVNTKYKYQAPTMTNIKNCLQEAIDDKVSNLIFYFFDHGGNGYMCFEHYDLYNNTLWSYLKQIEGKKICFLACCHAGYHGKNAETNGGVKNFVMWCATSPLTSCYKTVATSGQGRHVSTTFSTYLFYLFNKLCEYPYSTAWTTLVNDSDSARIQQGDPVFVKYKSSDFDESQMFLK